MKSHRNLKLQVWKNYVPNFIVSHKLKESIVRIISLSYGSEQHFSVIHPNMAQSPWWRHQMEIFSALLALCEGNLPVTAWTNCSTNNLDAGDLRHYRACYDVIVMTMTIYVGIMKDEH